MLSLLFRCYTSLMRTRSLGVLLLVCACGVEVKVDAGLESDAGQLDAAVVIDAGAHDAGLDAGFRDAGLDAGLGDAGTESDAGKPDAGEADAGVDAGLVDAGVLDAGFDAGVIVCGRCQTYAPSKAMGAISESVLKEASGLAASRAHPGVLYSHNDSGGLPVVYVLNDTGASLGQLTLTGATNVDWEDIALGPCPTGTCIYIGEIGDNNAVYPNYYVYRIAEPNVSVGSPIGSQSVAFERFEIQYPGQAKFNAETLLVHPATGDVYVVTKPNFGTKSDAYKASAPLSTSTPNVMVKVAPLTVPEPLDQVTAGDIDACGTTLVLRTYHTAYQYQLTPGAAFDTIFSSTPVQTEHPAYGLNINQEIQGESITWGPLGGYYTVSEGASAQLHFIGCQ